MRRFLLVVVGLAVGSTLSGRVPSQTTAWSQEPTAKQPAANDVLPPPAPQRPARPIPAIPAPPVVIKPEKELVGVLPYPDRVDLTYYVDRQGHSQPLTELGGWRIRRQHILERMQQVMGSMPTNAKRVPLDVTVLSEELLDGVLRRKIEYTTEPGDRVRAWLMIPSNPVVAKVPPTRRFIAGVGYPPIYADVFRTWHRGQASSYVEYSNDANRFIDFKPYVIHLTAVYRRPYSGYYSNYPPDTSQNVRSVVKTRVQPTAQITVDPRLPAVLCLHQTNGALGKDEPAGLGGNPNLHYAIELAQRGFVTLTPDYPSFGEHPFDFKDPKFAWTSGTLKAIWDNMRAIDLLQSMPDVNPQRIGCIGHSLGGHNTMFTAAFDERIKAMVSCCGFTRFHKYYNGDLKGWTSDRYMPAINDLYHNNPNEVPFDFPEIVAAFAPRAFMAVAPQHDDNFEVSGVVDSLAQAKRIYAMYGAADKLVGEYPDAKHDFPPESRVKAYRFLQEQLAR